MTEYNTDGLTLTRLITDILNSLKLFEKSVFWDVGLNLLFADCYG